MKREIFYGAVAMIATIASTQAQTLNYGYISTALGFLILPFTGHVASQMYPENNLQQTQNMNSYPYYSNNGRWRRVQVYPEPDILSMYGWQQNAYGQSYFRPLPTMVTTAYNTPRSGGSRRDLVPSDTRGLRIESRISQHDVTETERPVPNRNTDKTSGVVPLNTEESVNTRFANSRPYDEVTVDADRLIFDRSQYDTQNNQFEINPSTALTSFGLEMMKALNVEQLNNPAVSPYSVALLLALLQQGASGNSEVEISQALSMDTSKSRDAFRTFLNSVKSKSTRNVLKIATNIFVSNSFDLKTTFKNTAVQSFESDVTPMSFGDAYLSARKINNWVAEKTQNHIPELVNADALGPNTQMVLANAIFFKGLWHTMFDPRNTTAGDFRLPNGSVKRVQYMRARFGLAVGVDVTNGMYYGVMPFEGDQYKMMFLISEQDDLKTAINKLTSEKLLEYLRAAKKDVRVAIPKFTVQSDMDLKTVLNKMGIRDIFSRQSSLYDVGTYMTTSPQITSALHKAVLSVDERGGVAAAATAFPAVALSFGDAVIDFEMNRPFLAVLWDAEDNVPLFMARVDDPTL